MSSEELWLPVPLEGYKYEVSNFGRIRNPKGLVLKHHYKSKYPSIGLSSHGAPGCFQIHRLVALAFIPNDDPLKTVVNHRDGNRSNNHAGNLEWVTLSGNTKHAIEVLKRPIYARPVLQHDLAGNFLKRFASVKEAAEEVGVDGTNICAVIGRKTRSSGGFRWTYETEREKGINLEEFTDVPGFDNYMASRDGRVYGKKYKRLLTPRDHASEYTSLILRQNNVKKCISTHIIVARTFLPNPEGKKVVNHINGNKLDNRVENLEWATHKENSQAAVKIGIIKTKPVDKLNKEGVFLASYPSVCEAHRQHPGIQKITIIKCCKGKAKTGGGFIWRYNEGSLSDQLTGLSIGEAEGKKDS